MTDYKFRPAIGWVKKMKCLPIVGDVVHYADRDETGVVVGVHRDVYAHLQPWVSYLNLDDKIQKNIEEYLQFVTPSEDYRVNGIGAYWACSDYCWAFQDYCDKGWDKNLLWRGASIFGDDLSYLKVTGEYDLGLSKEIKKVMRDICFPGRGVEENTISYIVDVEGNFLCGSPDKPEIGTTLANCRPSSRGEMFYTTRLKKNVKDCVPACE